MDAFYAAIEQRDHPEWRGKSVIVGGTGRRGVVATASYEARAFGVHSAMPGAVARRLCPQGIFVPPRMASYATVSRQVFEIFESFTPLVEPLSLDEAFLDVTASRELFGDGATIAARIQARVLQSARLTISVGVASSKFVAKVASDLRKPKGRVVVLPGGEAAFLAPLPVSRLWGAGKVTQQQFESLGLRTIGDVQRLSAGKLARHLGDAAARHYALLSRGLDDREVEPEREARSIGRETTFEDDLADDDRIRRVLLELSEDVGRRLRREGLRGVTVKLKLRYPPFTTLTRQKRLARPTWDDLVLYRAALELLERTRPPGKPVRLLGVAAVELRPASVPLQPELFDGGESPLRSDRILRALDAIRRQFGPRSIGHGIGRERPVRNG
jgi:DNA polymerase IV